MDGWMDGWMGCANVSRSTIRVRADFSQSCGWFPKNLRRLQAEVCNPFAAKYRPINWMRGGGAGLLNSHLRRYPSSPFGQAMVHPAPAGRIVPRRIDGSV